MRYFTQNDLTGVAAALEVPIPGCLVDGAACRCRCSGRDEATAVSSGPSTPSATPTSRHQQHEAAPRPRHQPECRMASSAPHPREGTDRQAGPFDGLVEANETHAGRVEDTHGKIRRERTPGSGAVAEAAVVSVKDLATGRGAATVVNNAIAVTLQGLITDPAKVDPMIDTDDHKAYVRLSNRQSVCHSVAEDVNGRTHVDGVACFWAGLRLGCHGTIHRVGPEHLDCYVRKFVGGDSRRRLDTKDMMGALVAGMVGKHLPYAKQVAA